MRITAVRLGGLAALSALLLGGAILGQQPPGAADRAGEKKAAEEKKPSQLEEMIAQALRDNPDVRVAEAKMREAEAELNRARLLVIQKIVAHQHDTETLEGAVKNAEARYEVADANLKLAEAEAKRMAEIVKKGVAPQSEAGAAEVKAKQAEADREAAKGALQAAKAELAKARAALPYLLGKGTKDAKEADAVRYGISWLVRQQGNGAAAEALWGLTAAQAGQPKGTVADKLRKALDASVTVKFDGVPLRDVLEYLQEQSGVPIVTAAAAGDLLDKPLTLNLRDIPLGAAFQLLEDVAGAQFAVRDYGVLVEAKTNQLAPGMLPLRDFWKGGDKPKAADEKPRPSGKNAPPGNVEGRVIRTDAASGLVEISIGSDAGLATGHTLEIYRLPEGDKEARYLGTLRIEQAAKNRAVGKLAGRPPAPSARVMVGDHVGSRVVGE